MAEQNSTGPNAGADKPKAVTKPKVPVQTDIKKAPSIAAGSSGRRFNWRLVRKILIVCGILGFLGMLAGVSTIVGVFWYYGRGIEGIDVAAIRDYRPKQVTRIVARDGTVLGELYSERRTLIAFEELPTHVVHAFLAAEDADFYHHKGMDYVGMVRAMISNIEAGEIRQGASTITQQVVKNFLLSPERTFERKIQELLLARRLEQALSKEEILELYLNEIYFGHGRYGVEEASLFYFGVSVREISIGQAAMLASLPKAPSKGSPYKDRERAKGRQVYVLRQMARHGFATPQAADEAIQADLDVLDDPPQAVSVEGAQEFVDAARRTLEEVYGQEKLDRLGATVTTTVDLQLQQKAREAVRSGLIALDMRQGFGHKVKPVSEKRQKKVLEQVKGSLAIGGNYLGVVLPRDGLEPPEPDVVPMQVGKHRVWVSVPEGSRYDEPDTSLEEQFPSGGLTRVTVTQAGKDDDPWFRGAIGSGPQAAVTLADVETGEVLALIGGLTYGRGEFNRVLDARRQPGSSFKPFVYGAALASETFTPATLVSDSPEIYEKWRPTNYEVDVYRGDIRLRTALTHSVNTVAIKLVDAVGVEAVHAFARAAGIEAELVDNLALALGVSELTPFDLLAGYLTLARGGKRIPPTMIRSIEVPGQEAWTPDRPEEQSLREDVVFVLTSIMTSVVEEGTGRGAKKLERPAAGKTGTSSDIRDAWFAGFTPRHVAIAWVGFDVPKRLGSRESGGKTALPIWLGAMQAAEADKPPLSFTPPASVLVRTIDRESGLLAPGLVEGPDGTMVPPGAETILEEYFVAGTEPVDVAEPAAKAPGDALLDLYGDEEDAPGLDRAPGLVETDDDDVPPPIPSDDDGDDELPPPLPGVLDEPG